MIANLILASTFGISSLQNIHVTLSRYRCKNYISFTNPVTSEVAQDINNIGEAKYIPICT